MAASVVAVNFSTAEAASSYIKKKGKITNYISGNGKSRSKLCAKVKDGTGAQYHTHYPVKAYIGGKKARLSNTAAQWQSACKTFGKKYKKVKMMVKVYYRNDKTAKESVERQIVSFRR